VNIRLRSGAAADAGFGWGSWLYVPALATLLGQRIWWPAKPAPIVEGAHVPGTRHELQPAGR
jgi:hypothetical protein